MPTPYIPSGKNGNDYRCFLIDLKLKEDTMVTGFSVFPGQKEYVHHALLNIVEPNLLQEAIKKENESEKPGWNCPNGAEINGVGTYENSIGLWLPGRDSYHYPEKTGKVLEAGTQMILHLHYHVYDEDNVVPDQTKVVLHTEKNESEFREVYRLRLLAPVELKCSGAYPENSEDPCNRNYALKNLHDASPYDTSPNEYTHILCNTHYTDYLDRDIQPGDLQTTTCDTVVKEDGYAIGVDTHMHLRGVRFQIELNPDSQYSRTLHDKTSKNFYHELDTWFKYPIPIYKGDTVRITCTHDNNDIILGLHGDLLEPQYTLWGMGAYDEMCYGGLHWIKDV